jgi:hypothetical protein
VIVQLESIQLIHKHAHKDITYIHRNLVEKLAEAPQNMKIPLELENLEVALLVCGFNNLNHQRGNKAHNIFKYKAEEPK